MAATKISALPSASVPLAGTEVLPIVQSAVTDKVAAADLLRQSGQTVTTSNPVLSLAQTWNAGAVTFTGDLINYTDTASAAGSLVLDRQVGGASVFSVRKDGLIVTANVLTNCTGLPVAGLVGAVGLGQGGTGQVTANASLNALLPTQTANSGKVLSTDGTNTLWIAASGSGTVTSVAALTLGTAGTDLSSSVATATTTPVITLNVPTASASNRGALSSGDWSTFNGKQSAITFGTGVQTWIGTPSMANLVAAVTGDTPVGRATTDTLTNKTLTTPVISSISNTGTLTLPTSTDTLVGRATTDTLINKTLTTPVISSIVNTGTLTLPTSTDTLIGRATTDTLTNKRVTQRVSSVANVTSPWAWNADSFDLLEITALANALTINADAGTPTDGQRVIFRIKDNGTARALTWTTGASKAFRVIGQTLPTTTVISKLSMIGCIYNAGADRWDVVAVSQEA